MKKKYDFDALTLQHGFSPKEIGKACRISDLLEDISAVKYLSDYHTRQARDTMFYSQSEMVFSGFLSLMPMGANVCPRAVVMFLM